MAAERYPKIELEYRLKGNDADSSVAFAMAGKKYADTRSDAEVVEIVILPREKHTSVKYGRKVIETMSYAEISHEADEMQADIENRIAQFGVGSVAIESYIGSRLSGNLPDQE